MILLVNIIVMPFSYIQPYEGYNHDCQPQDVSLPYVFSSCLNSMLYVLFYLQVFIYSSVESIKAMKP